MPQHRRHLTRSQELTRAIGTLAFAALIGVGAWLLLREALSGQLSGVLAAAGAVLGAAALDVWQRHRRAARAKRSRQNTAS
ncbi:hypothetical protein [Kineococcus gypseus]|uniref:hypothetical protein n=1 Tax=Kineococcus gypseus TaxID=1637102 RepID=UPI003D7CE2AC